MQHRFITVILNVVKKWLKKNEQAKSEKSSNNLNHINEVGWKGSTIT